ncbi:MAG: alpha/beta hydrolase family protein [Candidatus Limnocylindria bacterium]
MLIGGTFSDLRDADADPRHRPDIPPHGMYRVLSDGLVDGGFAVLRFDRRGCGSSTGSRPDRATEIADALAAWTWLAQQESVTDAVGMVGESAGAYVLCRVMAAGATPRAVVLQGALHRPIGGLIAFNASRARAYWERGEAERAWMWANARREYESAVTGASFVKAIAEGQQTISVIDERGTFERSLDDLEFDLRHPPAEQFRFVRCPCLIIHGVEDLNVPVEDAFETARSLWAAGNRDVELVILPRADHSFQRTPGDEDERLRERMTMESFRRPFHQRYPSVIVEYLVKTLLNTSAAEPGSRQ